jgi:transketolase
MSAADLTAVLLSKYLHYDFDEPRNPNNDHLIFSKGHASPLLYSLYKAAGAVSEEELLTFRTFGSRLEGHPVPELPWVDVATGSLGQGLPISVGVALAGKYLDRLPFRVWTLCGDSEIAEGSMWEAFEHAAFYQLYNLVAILDINRLGQRGETMHGWDLNSYANRVRAFGWKAIEIDGHDFEEIDRAYAEAIETHGQPTAIVARTIKGKGVKAVENKEGWHGKALDDPEGAIEELGGIRNIVVDVPKPQSDAKPHEFETGPLELPTYEVGDEVATRKAYGDALAAIGSADGKVTAADGEVSNSTFAEIFRDAHPDRYFEMYIAEQQMVAAAVGLQVRGWKPFGSSFACFLTRAYDFIRMAAISRANIRLCGSHAGVSIGEDGPSQMGLEDLAAFRAVHSSTVLYPCDANQTAKLVAAMADLEGIAYIRTTRGATTVIYDAGEEFPVGGSKVVRSSEDDEVAIVAAGITLHEALKAADALAEEGVNARVIDLYSLKPIDEETLLEAGEATNGRIVTVEDHWPEGGLGEAVLSVFAQAERHPDLVKLAVSGMPGSGKPAELLAAAGIDAEHIAEAARKLAGARAVA